MIGDSEVSDAKLPGDFGIGTFHVLSERNAFFESAFGKAFSHSSSVQLSETRDATDGTSSQPDFLFCV